MRRLVLGLICLILSLSVARAQAPAPAAAVGYNTQTFGAGVTVGTTPNPTTSYPVFTTNRWAPYAFPGSSWTNIGFTTNSDGSVSMDGTGQAFGDGLATASPGPAGGPRTTFGGQTFGGGFYAVARMKGTGPMSFWANDIETQNGVSQGLGHNPWNPTQTAPSGQVAYGDWMELDMAEFDSTGAYGGAMHNWYAGNICSGNSFGTNFLNPPGNQACGINSLNSGSQFNAPPTSCCGGADFSQYHDYGFLWVPATGGSGGSTNILPNSAMAGAVVGSPGTLPTGWSIPNTAGLSWAVAGTGTDATTGKTYTRLRVFGTPTGGDFNISLANPSVAATASSNYTESAGIGVSAGSLANAGTVALITNDLDASNNYIQGALYNPITATGTVTTYSGSFLTTAATHNVSVGISLLGPTNGGAVDVTLQIENPQLLAASTSTGQGYAKWFFDGVQVGNTYTWNKYDPTLAPPPVDSGSGGSSAYSVLDTLHMYLILGGSPGSTTTVSSVQVWQASGANDLPVIGSHGESPDQTVVTTAGPTITDANGTIFAISSGAQILINGTADGTTANVIELAYVNHVLWQENAAGNWYNYLGTPGSYGGPTTTSPLTGAGTSTIAVNAIATQTASAAFTVSGTVLSGTDWSINPGQDGSFWKQPFQTSANWITSGPLITALRAGTPSINVKGNFGVPWVTGRATDPLVRVTDGTRSINVRMPLGTIIETPTSAFDQSIGGTDASQPYLVWSISGATMNTGSVQASGSVITGTYGFSIQDGSGLMMADKVTGVLGSNNSIGGIQPYDLAQILANPNYVIPHMLAFQLDSNTQASSAGPIWPLNLTDTSNGSYAGPIPQGVTVGIPANVVMPTGKTRAFKALWDQLQQQGMFNYNFGATGGVNFSVYDQTGAYASLIADLQAAWVDIGHNYLSILNYNTGVFGAQYNLATTKGAVAGSANAYPAPPLLNLSSTGGVNVAPSTFGAWYPNTSYSATPTNPGAPSGIPTLQYQDGSGAWQALPGGATVTGTTFSFTHPGIAATSSGQISVRDANFPSVVGVSNTFVVAGGSSTVPVPAPLTGTVTPNAWQAFDTTYAGVTLACGKPFHYILAQPPQYDGTLYKYPLYIWLHPDHSGDSWYINGTNPLQQAGNEAGSFNTQAFQTRYPAFYVAPSADQTDGNGTLNSCTTQADSAIKNWGGWFNNGSTGSGTVYSGDTGPNTFAIVAMINDLKSRYSIDPARVYINGFSLGGIYTDYACLHYNAYTGDKGKIFAACAGSAGVNQANSPPSNAATVAMQNVPQWMFSGANDTASPPGSWNSPLCTALGGSPSSLTGITSATANQCGTSAMRYTLCPTCGHQDTDASGNPVWSNQIINDFLFAQSAGSVAGGCGGGAESVNLATVTTVGPTITDANANTFAISSGGLILICGTADATTANVIQLAYVNHVVWQKNSAGNWYSYNGTPGSYNGPTTTSPLPAESPNNTSVTTVGPQITNANLTTFSISAGAQILINGVADTATANVVQLAYVNHVLWQRNTAGNWYNYLGTPGSYGGPTMNSPLTSGCGGGGGTGSFTVSGGHILAPNGSVFKGIGLNIGDFRTGLDMANAVTNFTTGAPLTTLFPGINFVRLALYGGGSDTSPTTYPVPSSYDAFVNTVTSLGIVVEFEHHIGTTGSSAGGGQGVVPAPGSAWVNAENANYAALAAHFKNNPRVWFGTNNEPPSATGLSQWQQSNYNAIRGTGNTNPIMLEVWGSRPPGYGGTTLQAGMVQSIYSAMTNVIWDPHVYPFINNNNTSQAVNNQTALDMISAAQSITSADGLVPVIIGEYGPSTTGSSIEANATQNVTGVLNSGVGSAVWHWGQQDCCNNTNNGNTLTALGTQVAAAIAANPVTVPVGLCKGHPMTLIFGANDNKLPAQRRAS